MKTRFDYALVALLLTAGAAFSQDAAQAEAAAIPTLQRVLFGVAVLVFLSLAYVMGRGRATAMRGRVAEMHSLPTFHGAVSVQYGALGVVVGLLVHTLAGQPVGIFGAILAAAVLGLLGVAFALSTIKPEFRARTFTERSVMVFLILCSLVAVLTTVGIIASLVFETAHFFRLYPASSMNGTVCTSITPIDNAPNPKPNTTR